LPTPKTRDKRRKFNTHDYGGDNFAKKKDKRKRGACCASP